MLTKYIEAFKSLKHEIWYDPEMSNREDVLQTIVDYYSHCVGVERLATVKIKDLPLGTMAMYDPATNEIWIRSDLATRGVIQIGDGKEENYKYPANYMFFHLAHEIKHAMQHYYLIQPEKCQDSEELMLIQANQKHTGSNTNSYFVRDLNRPDGLSIYTHYLYMLQPIEKCAWEFAYKQIEEFKAMMHELYPDDRAFIDNVEYSDFHEVCRYAMAMFDSPDPIRDVEKILLAMNGHKVDGPINEIMSAVIRDTQETHMYDKIKDLPTTGTYTIGEQIEELCDKDNLAPQDEDVSHLFADVERK